MLPRYRLLVEKLAGSGLLPVICGTDTLGVGVNIPIRTVVMSALTKYDGSRVRTLRAREFHQLAGRAGRPGFDPNGHVWAQAPEHVIDNERALAKAGDDPKARRKVKRAEAPKGFVHYDENTFNKLIAGTPEPLQSRFRVTPNLVATVLERPDGPDVLKALLNTNHDSPQRRRGHKLRAIEVYKSLESAGVAKRLRDADGLCLGVQFAGIDDDSPYGHGLRLTSPLGPFAIEVVASLDRNDAKYAYDVISVMESVLEDPMQILIAQEKAARGDELGRLKAQGVEYEDRLEALSKITWPKPQAELLDACFETYRVAHPWVGERPSPKSILREMIEGGETFTSYVQKYKIERTEGILLRYLSDAWKSLDRSLPDDAYNDELEDMIEWLDQMLRSVDASLLQEWENLASGKPPTDYVEPPPMASFGPPAAWRRIVRNAAFGWVELASRKAYGALAGRSGSTEENLWNSLAPYWETYREIATDADARSAKFYSIIEDSKRWTIHQTLCDPEHDNEWGFVAYVDVASAMEEGAPSLRLAGIGRFSEISHLLGS